jgi:HEAT repeat protein
MEDQQIRALLMAAARDATDPGLRAQTVTILTEGADAEDVRQALVFALGNDQNTDVRLKAMEGLKRFSGDPLVQDALARVLLSDSNTGMRTQAIDVLTARQGQALDRQIVGALQEMMNREDDSYVREQCQRMLHSIKASAEIY